MTKYNDSYSPNNTPLKTLKQVLLEASFFYLITIIAALLFIFILIWALDREDAINTSRLDKYLQAEQRLDEKILEVSKNER